MEIDGLTFFLGETSPMNVAVGKFHPIFLHFPIVLFTAALICDILNYCGRSRAFTVGHWLIIAATVSCIPTILTGLAAAESFDATDPVLLKHLFLGYLTGIFGSFYSGLRISAMRWQLPLLPVHYLWLSVLMVALVFWTSDYGGLLTRGVTPFSSLQAEVGDDEAIVSSKIAFQVTVKDVVPIFSAHHCEDCHHQNFSNGFPRHFFDKKDGAFLVRNPDGSLDLDRSSFYQTVIVENRMPIVKGKPVGLNDEERQILLNWLKSGAPME